MSYSLDDIKRAEGNTGADLIVFSDLRSKAADARKEIEGLRSPLADAMRQTDGQQRKLIRRRLLRTLGIATRQKKTEEDFLSEYKDAGATLLVQEQEEKIKKLDEQIKSVTSEIETGNSELDRLIKNIEDLGQRRTSESIAYAEAKTKYEDLRSSPEKALGSNPIDEDKKQVIDSVGRILDKIKSEEEGHEKQIAEVANWKDNLTAIRNAKSATDI